MLSFMIRFELIWWLVPYLLIEIPGPTNLLRSSLNFKSKQT